MAENRRVLISNTPSGPIELVLVQDAFLTLQFNCECTDALPYCRAICCRMRSGLNTILEPDEAGKFKTRKLKNSLILQSDPLTDACVYLTPDSKCQVHEDKPRMCAAWHCSPGGQGEKVKVRDGGWFMSPVCGNQQELK